MSSLFALFLVTSLANILTPGLGVVMIITLAAEYGWRRTMSGALGTALGIAFLFIAGMSGVGVIVASSPMLFAAIKLLGACFLIRLSVKTWRKVPPKIVIDAPGVQVPDNAGEGLFSKCFILAVTNPQPMIFCVSLMPQFIDPEIAYVPQVAFMIAVYSLMVFVCMIFYALIADRMRVFLARGSGPKLMNKASAVIFMLLACWVLWNTAQPFL